MALAQAYPTSGGIGGFWSSSSSTNVWLDIDELKGAPNDDTDYMFITVNGDHYINHVDFAIDSSAIAKVTMFMRARMTTGAASLFPYLRVNGTDYIGSGNALSTSYADYTEDWTTNPDTAASWLEADVEGSGSNPLEQFRVNTTGIGAEEMRVTQIYLEVDYTAAGGANPKGPLGMPLSRPLVGPLGGLM